MSARVPMATSAGPRAITATTDSAAAQRARCCSRIGSMPVRSAVSALADTFADGYWTCSWRNAVIMRSRFRSLSRFVSRNDRHV